MPNANGQHTDAENSKPMRTASNAGDALTKVYQRSAQAIAGDDGASPGQPASAPEVTAPFPGGDQ